MTEEDLEYISALKEIAESPAGKIVGKIWKNAYVRPSAIGVDPTATYYILSRKEFILELIDLINLEEEEMKVTTVTTEN